MNKTIANIEGVVQATWMSVGAAIALLLLGGIAALVPFATGVAIGILVIWVIIFSGLAHLVHAWDARDGVFLWRLLVGTTYLLGGLYLLINPVFDLPALTRFIGGMFAVESSLIAGWRLVVTRPPRQQLDGAGCRADHAHRRLHPGYVALGRGMGTCPVRRYERDFQRGCVPGDGLA